MLAAGRCLLVVGMKKSRPEMMPRSLPVDFTRTVLEPVGQSHITMSQVDGVCASSFGCHRILLRQYETHDLAELDVMQEELNVNGIGLVIAVRVALVFDEVFFSDHLDVRVIRVDRYWSTEGNSDGAVSCEKRPPYSFP